ncbi:PAS domain S-box protein [uncultured Methanoregula sp.]|uniref:PAS domain S-box protein n=1 Tax=uncultured Methanoregula sp. TaxID=1005933 RepID=UPI002AAB9AE0|nr:PAS domain S-box protein [uncultured Methanoregula sp.]
MDENAGEGDEATRIRAVLRNHPQGLSIKEISFEVSMSRNSVAKYLEVLMASGQLDLRHVGNAKLYTLSRRIPVGSIINHTGELIIVLDDNLRVVQASDSFCAFTGLPRADIHDARLSSLPAPILSAAEEGELLPLMHGGPTLKKEIRVVRNGDEVFFSGRFIPALLGNGVTAVTCILEDITERVRAERATRERDQLLHTIFHIPTAPQFYIDRNHKVVYWDRALEIMTGIKAEVVIGTHDHWKAFYSGEYPCLIDLVVDGNPRKIFEMYPEISSCSPDAEGRYEFTGFFSAVGPRGKWLHLTAMPVRDPAGNLTGAMETVEDVTDKKNREFVIQD